ncbi:MAG: hypothetical protein KDE20_27245, partial [Caldilineaceae bacterium]|nr:hypothetical protein [Caldilineaceae bacterium]
MLDVLADEGIGCIGFSPLCQGILTDKYLNEIPDDSRADKIGGQFHWGDSVSDARIATLLGVPRAEVAAHRKGLGLQRVYKRVDTCAAEFESFTPYLYSTFEDEDEAGSSESDRVIILGNGPNRIGQGLEFDYCCVHAAYAVAEAGLTSVMVNCNPETVSTDYDTSDRLYFEPLTLEDVLNIVDRERAAGDLLGLIVQYGGQTPLNLANAL